MSRRTPSTRSTKQRTSKRRRADASRQRAATRDQQRDAEQWDQRIAQEERDGGRYALLNGNVVYFGPGGSGPSDFMSSDAWDAWMTHHLRRRGRAFSTQEEALFVLFGHEPPGLG